jgi:excisionase family DNA binding protein
MVDIPIGTSLSADDRRLAGELGQRLVRLSSRKTRQPVKLQFAGRGATTDEAVPLPSVAVRLVGDLLTALANGQAVALVPLDSELSTQQAAELLQVSRPFVIQLMEKGDLPHHKVGTHRRVRLSDVLEYKRRIDEARQVVLAELTREAQELELGYE